MLLHGLYPQALLSNYHPSLTITPCTSGTRGQLHQLLETCCTISCPTTQKQRGQILPWLLAKHQSELPAGLPYETFTERGPRSTANRQSNIT